MFRVALDSRRSRSRPNATRGIAQAGGYNRRDSLNTLAAKRNQGRWAITGRRVPSTALNSAANFDSISGCSASRYHVRVSATAVVSCPARNSVITSSRNCLSVSRPSWSSACSSVERRSFVCRPVLAPPADHLVRSTWALNCSRKACRAAPASSASFSVAKKPNCHRCPAFCSLSGGSPCKSPYSGNRLRNVPERYNGSGGGKHEVGRLQAWMQVRTSGSIRKDFRLQDGESEAIALASSSTPTFHCLMTGWQLMRLPT